MIKLIVLDRDGVINEDSSSYIKSPEEWNAIPGSIEAIAKLRRNGYKIVIATNQSGIARRLFTPTTLALIHKKMITQIEMAGGQIDNIFICPHRPQDNCTCRKPKPGLILKAAQQFNIEPTEILVIGDAMCDILAAKSCGASAILVRTGKGEHTEHTMMTMTEDVRIPIYNNLACAVDSLFIARN